MLGRGLKRGASLALRAFAQESAIVKERIPSSCNVAPACLAAEARAAFNRTSSRSYFNNPRNDYVHFKQQQPADRQRRRTVILLGTGTVVAVVYVSHLEEVPYTHRRHFVLVSPEFEKTLGIQQFQKVKAQAEAEGKLLPPSHPATVSVRRIGKKVAASAVDDAGGGRHDHMKNLEWEFVVIDEPEIPNAFVMPGGKVVVYTGILKLLRTEKEVAAVLSHEVGHVVGRHIGEKLSTFAAVWGLGILVALLMGIQVPMDLVQIAIELPNSRKIETEADIIGTHIAARACYDPAAAVLVFTKLGEVEKRMGVKIPTLLRTHPLSEDRVKAIEKELPKALQDYERAGCNVPRQFFSFGSGW